jgi:hypothetical protein
LLGDVGSLAIDASGGENAVVPASGQGACVDHPDLTRRAARDERPAGDPEKVAVEAAARDRHVERAAHRVRAVRVGPSANFRYLDLGLHHLDL